MGTSYLSFADLVQKFPIGNSSGNMFLPITEIEFDGNAPNNSEHCPSPSPISFAKQMAFDTRDMSSLADLAFFSSLAFAFLAGA